MTEPRTILVSGGSKGLGEAIVRYFLESGERVATFSRKPTPFTEQAPTEWPGQFFYQSVDASDAEALRRFVSCAHREFGGLDALINNAGIAHDGVLALMSEDRIDQMLSINLRASLILAKECARLMLLRESGHIVNISSIIAENGFSGLSAYAATKAGQLGMTRALARELGPRGIRVNAIAPGYLETEMSHGLSDKQREQIVRRTPLGRLGKPADVVGCIGFLISPAASFITGQVITVDGGGTA